MRVTIEIQCDGVAFDPDQGRELSRILGRLARRLPDGKPDNLTLFDSAGNGVGTLTVTDDLEDDEEAE